MSIKDYKISFCIVCRNRLHQLKETLLQNIVDNSDYPNLEILLFDYNSSDGLGIWIKENFRKYIGNGLLQYFHTSEPSAFHFAHSKNVIFKMAVGDIICNLNADHFTGAGFATFVNSQFNLNNDFFLSGMDFKNKFSRFKTPSDLAGKICIKREDFYTTEGYDERMGTYGFDDEDFVNRLMMAKKRSILINNSEFSKFIRHDDSERFSFEKSSDKYLSIICRPISPSESSMILMEKSGELSIGTIINTGTLQSSDYKRAFKNNKIKEPFHLKEDWIIGSWKVNNNNITILINNGGTMQLKFNKRHKFYTASDGIYYLLKNANTLNVIAHFRFFSTNYFHMKNNLARRIINPNNGCFGRSTVFKNFTDFPIVIR